ncbi:MAG: hypothetical protein ACLSG4_00180 [Anaerobutyricum sp.]
MSSSFTTTGGTSWLACATLEGKKMVFDQKPPFQREQVDGSSLYPVIRYVNNPRPR